MALRTETETLSMLNIATMDYMEEAVSQIQMDNAFVARMEKKSKAAKGGDRITVPLLVDEDTVQSMGPYTPYNLQPKEIMDRAYFNWKRINESPVLDDMTVDVMNVDSYQLLDIAKTKVQQCTQSFRKKKAQLLHTPSASLLSTDPDSLVKIVATANNTVGGIDAATGTDGTGTVSLNYSWNPKIIDATGSLITYANLKDPTHKYAADKIPRLMLGQTCIGTEKTSLILCTQVFWDALEELNAAKKIFSNNLMEIDGGFKAIDFRGIPIVVDSNVPGGQLNDSAYSDYYGHVLFLNENYLGYRHSPAMNYKFTPWFRLEQQPVYACHLDWAGALITSNRQRQGAFIGIPKDSQVYTS
jgi:hypothetical protein